MRIKCSNIFESTLEKCNIKILLLLLLPLQNQKDPGVLDRMMKKLDLNSDGQLDFQEFLNLIGGIAVACHDSFLKASHSQKRI